MLKRVISFYLVVFGQTSKFDRFSLLNNLPSVLNFAKSNLSKGRKLLVCCDNGKRTFF